MDGYELAGRFSYITNALKYCGPEEGHKHFHKYISEKHLESKEKIREAIKKFEALYPYLKFISEKTGTDFLDYDVVEAYWMGNELLERFNREDMQDLVRLLTKRGLPESMGEKLIEKMPAGAIPFHAFHVFYVGVGNVTGHVKTTIPNMDNCRISVGEIVEIIGTHLIVNTDSIVEKSGQILLEDTTKTIVYAPELLPDIVIGDNVAIHWGFACKKIDAREIANIKKYTDKSIEMKNSVTNNIADNFVGVIIEESLEKKDVLKKIKILKTEIEEVTEKHKTPWLKRWTLHTVEIPKKDADIIAKELSYSLDTEHNWYADFKNPTHHYIIFRNKIFYIDRQNREQYDAAKKYGISLGIPEYQVDFHPDIEEWKR